MAIQLNIPSPIQQLKSTLLDECGVELWIKRDDLIHPTISGNKWRKLEYNILKAQENNLPILTFGGAYSNHIAATAAACQAAGIPAIGMIRGEEHDGTNPTLSEAKKKGMDLHFISREDYSFKEEEAYIRQLKEDLRNFHLVPEGGSNYYGVMGCTNILKEMDEHFHTVCIAGGTGTTAAGLLLSATENQKIELFPALKGGQFLEKNVKSLLLYSLFEELAVEEAMCQLELISGYHFGGYAKIKPALIDFVNQFYSDHQIPLDLIYNGKMMFGIFERLAQGAYPRGQKILAIHTGGIQGNEGFKERLGVYLAF